MIGDLMLDHYCFGECSRLSPDAPVPVVVLKDEQEMLGGAANVSLNLKSLGCKTYISGFLGKDVEGDKCFSMLKDHGIHSDTVIRTSNPTTAKIRVIGNGQHLIRYDREESHSSIEDRENLVESLRDLDVSFDAIVVSDYTKGVVSAEIMEALPSIFPGVRIFVDPKPANICLYNNVFCISPNFHEALRMTDPSLSDPEDLAKGLKDRLGVDVVLITMSQQGVYVSGLDQDRLFEAYSLAKKDTVRPYRVDVVGAGDTFIATFAALMISDASLFFSTCLANMAAGIVVNKQGTQVIDLDELNKEIDYAKKMVADAG